MRANLGQLVPSRLDGIGLLKPLLVAVALLATCGSAALAQSDAGASRAGDLQIGAGFTSANSDYTTNRISGLAFYADFDLTDTYGVEVDFHQVSDSTGSQVYERTYEIGGRYLHHFGRIAPYGKVLVGRGVFNYPQSEANLAYNMAVLGGGVDFTVHPRVNVRADFEYQDWFGFQPNGLTPTLFTIGVAYHFPAGPLAR